MRAFVLAGVAATALVTGSPGVARQNGPANQEAPSPTAGNRTTVYDAAFFAQYAPRTAYDIVQHVPGFTLDLGQQCGFDRRGRARLRRDRRQCRHQRRAAEHKIRDARHPAQSNPRLACDPRRGRSRRSLRRRLFEQIAGREHHPQRAAEESPAISSSRRCTTGSARSFPQRAPPSASARGPRPSISPRIPAAPTITRRASIA